MTTEDNPNFDLAIAEIGLPDSEMMIKDSELDDILLQVPESDFSQGSYDDPVL